VHDRILPDRPLDETHPLWMSNHYGAHKAAIEAFVQSYGHGLHFPICALRPTGIHGLAEPARASKWFGLVQDIVNGRPVQCRGGGKEVHALDVARAAEILLEADAALVTGQAFNCCDRYVSDHEVATIARELAQSPSEITGVATVPKHEIITAKLAALGMSFGGRPLLEQTIRQLIDSTRS
jgi:nucleoside-diphosphate-sugar epimerase